MIDFLDFFLLFGIVEDDIAAGTNESDGLIVSKGLNREINFSFAQRVLGQNDETIESTQTFISEKFNNVFSLFRIGFNDLLIVAIRIMSESACTRDIINFDMLEFVIGE